VSTEENKQIPPKLTEEELMMKEANQPSMMSETPAKSGFKLGGGLLPMIVIAVIISLVVFIGMGALGLSSYVSKSDFTTNLGNVSKTIEQVTSDMAKKQGEVTTAIQGIPATVKQSITDTNKTLTEQLNDMKGEVGTYSTKILDATNQANKSVSDLGTYKTQTDQKIADLTKANTDLTTKVTTLTATVTAYETRIAKLETSSTGDSQTGDVTTDKITIGLEDVYGLEIRSSEYNFIESDEALKLTITNNNTTGISGLRLYIYLYPDDTFPVTYVESASLGGDKTCTLSYYDNDQYKFKMPKLSIAAGKSVTVYLTPSIMIKSYYPYLTNNVSFADDPTIYAVSGYVGNWYLTNNIVGSLGILGTDYLINTYQYGLSKLNQDVTFSTQFEVVDYNID
jgi:hypothetical protein